MQSIKKVTFSKKTATTQSNLFKNIFEILLICGVFHFVNLAFLWIMYFSIVTLAEHTPWYSYGWESQLLETGFLAIFLGSSTARSRHTPSLLIIYLFRWLMFRKTFFFSIPHTMFFIFFIKKSVFVKFGPFEVILLTLAGFFHFFTKPKTLFFSAC